MKTIKCKCCGHTIKMPHGFSVGEIVDKGWGVIWDVSNGLTSIYLCEDCHNKIQEHVEAIENMLDMPFWKINIPSNRGRED